MILLGIGGGSGSGKSWLAAYLKRRLGLRAVVISQDWYYRDMGHLSEAAARRLNVDHPRAIDTPLLLRDMGRLLRGRSIEAPVYDYASHSRLKKVRRIKPAAVIILEGLFVLSIPAVRESLDYSVYIDVPDDLRLIRRIRRDVEERHVGLEETLRLYEHCVRPMHKKFIGPSAARATWIWDQLKDRRFPRTLLKTLTHRKVRK